MVSGRVGLAGFSIDSAVRTYWLLDSYVYGHVIQEVSTTLNTQPDEPEPKSSVLEQRSRADHPHLDEVEEHATEQRFSFDTEFEFGLDLILDALDRAKAPTTD